MGMDGVILMLEVEERFGISIRDDEAVELRTVGDLTQLVLARFEARRSLVCPTRTAFAGVRDDVRTLLAIPNLRLRPRQRIADVIPAAKRPELWRRLRERMNSEPPSLERPLIVKRLLLVASAALVALAFWPVTIDPKILPLSFLLAFLGMFLLMVFTRPLCLSPPKKLSTFGDAARVIASVQIATRVESPDDPTTWVPNVLRDIIAEVLGVKKEEVVPEARFIQDLKME